MAKIREGKYQLCESKRKKRDKFERVQGKHWMAYNLENHNRWRVRCMVGTPPELRPWCRAPSPATPWQRLSHCMLHPDPAFCVLLLSSQQPALAYLVLQGTWI